MGVTIHRVPLADGFGAVKPQGSDGSRVCADCGEPAEVGLEYYDHGKYTPGDDLCWDCSQDHGPFDSDRGAESLGQPPWLKDGQGRGRAGALGNRELAEAVRDIGKDPTGDTWLAARLLRRQQLPVTLAELETAEACVRSVTSRPEQSHLSHHEIEAAIDDEWERQHHPPSSFDAASPATTLDTVDRSYWFFVWRDEIFRDRPEPLSEGQEGEATCHESTRAGDLAVLYRGRPASRVVALLEVLTDAIPNDLGRNAQARNWRHLCRYRVITTIEDGLTFDEMTSDPELSQLAAVSRRFQGSAIPIAPEMWELMIDEIAQRHAGLRDALSRLEDPPLRTVFQSESDLDEFLVENLHLFSRVGLELELANEEQHAIRGRQPVLAGNGHRPDIVCWDRRHGRFVVIEIKNVPAAPEHVGQLANYIGWFVQYLDRGVGAVGLLVTEADTPAATSARVMTPSIEHLTIGELLGRPALPRLAHDGMTISDVSSAAAKAALDLAAVAEARFPAPGQHADLDIDTWVRALERAELKLEAYVALVQEIRALIDESAYTKSHG